MQTLSALARNLLGIRTRFGARGRSLDVPQPLLKVTVSAVAMTTLLCAASGQVHAQRVLSDVDITINGFLTAGATVSNSEFRYLTDTSEDISFQEDSAFGLQVGAILSPKLSLDAQILAAGDVSGNFDARVDWAFATYRINENVAVRGGRLRIPVYLVSEYNEVGYSYPWIRPPDEVYSNFPFNGAFGADLVLSFEVGPGELLVQPFFYTIKDDIELSGRVTTADIDNAFGGVVAYEHDYFLLRASLLDGELSIARPFPSTDFRIVTVGGRVDWNNIVAYAEYSHTDLDEPFFSDSDSWYTTLGYRIGDFLPYATIAGREADNPRTGQSQRSHGLGVRYEVTNNSALKFQWDSVKAKDGTRGLFQAPPGKRVNVFGATFDLVF